MLDKNILAKLEYINGEIFINVYKRDNIIQSVEVTDEAIEAVLYYGLHEAQKTLDDEVTYSHPTSKYKMVIKQKDAD